MGDAKARVAAHAKSGDDAELADALAAAFAHTAKGLGEARD